MPRFEVMTLRTAVEHAPGAPCRTCEKAGGCTTHKEVACTLRWVEAQIDAHLAVAHKDGRRAYLDACYDLLGGKLPETPQGLLRAMDAVLDMPLTRAMAHAVGIYWTGDARANGVPPIAVAPVPRPESPEDAVYYLPADVIGPRHDAGPLGPISGLDGAA